MLSVKVAESMFAGDPISTIRRTAIGLIATALMTTGFMTAASAQQAPTRGITVVPPNIVLDGTPGQTIDQTINLENNSDVKQQVTLVVKNFKPSGEEGQAAPTDEDSGYSMAKWINVSPNATTLDPGERTSFAAKISIPQNAEPGSHYASIVFTPRPDGQPRQGFVTTTEVTSLILLKTPGAARQGSSIEEFSAKVIGDGRGPVDFSARIANTGNVHFIPKGSVTVTDTFGRTVEEIPFNADNHPVLPEAIRHLQAPWETGRLIGRYKATLNLTYDSNVPGEPQKTLTASTTFFVLPPLWMTIGVLAVIALLVAAVLRNRRRRHPARHLRK